MSTENPKKDGIPANLEDPKGEKPDEPKNQDKPKKEKKTIRQRLHDARVAVAESPVTHIAATAVGGILTFGGMALAAVLKAKRTNDDDQDEEEEATNEENYEDDGPTDEDENEE